MLRLVTGFIYRQRPPHQGFGFRQPVGGLQQLRQIVEADGDFGMLQPVTGFYRQRPPHQGFGLNPFREIVATLPGVDQQPASPGMVLFRPLHRHRRKRLAPPHFLPPGRLC